MLESREILWRSFSRRTDLQTMVKTTAREAHRQEMDFLRESLRLRRSHEAFQHALSTATFMSQLVEPCEQVGVNVQKFVQYETAQVLWDQNEMSTSIRMLEDLRMKRGTDNEAFPIGTSELLATLVCLMFLP